MTAARALRIDDWVVHRPNVVRSVAARVPGIDAEEATSRALEKMVRIVSTGGQIDDPAPYWRRAAVNEAISMTREAGRARPVEDDTLDGLTPPVAGAELDAERQADVSMLRTALADLAEDDRQILLERHVHDKAVSDIATGLGVRPHAVTMRLRRAEERLAGAFAAAHAHAVNEPECRATRAAMHDYLKDRLLPRRRARVEAHMDGCAECTRAFLDVREVSWMLRDYGQHIVAGALATGALGAVIGAGAAGAAGGGAAGAAGAGAPRSFGKKEAAIVAGVLAVLAVGGGAMALVANQPDEPPAAQSVPNPGAGGGGGGAGGGGAGGGGGGAGSGSGGAGDGADAGSGGAGGEAAGAGGESAGDEGTGGDGAGGDGAGSEGGGAEPDGTGGQGTANGDGTADGSGSADGPDSGSAEGGEPGDAPGTGSDEGSGTSGTDGPPDAESGTNDGANGDGSGTSDGPAADIGAGISDWLSSLGIGDGTPGDGDGSGSDTPPGTGTAGDGDASNESDGSGTSNGSDGDGTSNGSDGDGTSNGSDGGSQLDDDGSDGTSSGVGAEIKDWLATLGIGDGTPSDGEDGAGTSGGADTGSGTDDGSGTNGGSGAGGGTGSDTADPDAGDGASPGSDGPSTADGTATGIGAEMTSWLARLGTLGIPGFLLIVVILWLWERWSRTEEDR